MTGDEFVEKHYKTLFIALHQYLHECIRLDGEEIGEKIGFGTRFEAAAEAGEDLNRIRVVKIAPTWNVVLNHDLNDFCNFSDEEELAAMKTIKELIIGRNK